MSWWRMLLLGDFGQQVELHEQRDQLKRVCTLLDARRGRDSRQDERLERLELEVLHLNAGIAAVTNLARTKKLVTDAELTAALTAAMAEVEQAAASAAEQRRVAEDAAARSARTRRRERRQRGS